MSWHVHAEALQGYTEGTLDTTQQYSVEAHLMSCDTCRSALTTFADPERLARAWETIATQTAMPAPGVIERVLVRIGVKDHDARLLAATPSLRRSWLVAVGVVLSVAVGVAHGAAEGFLFFLAIAPMLPLAGIAAAFGPGIDPTYEIGVVSPLRSFRLLLIRALAVLVTTMGLGLIAAMFLPEINWATAAWLLPSLGLVTTSLALSTVVHPLRAAIIVAAMWVGAVSATALAASGPGSLRTAFGEVMQVGVLIVTIAAGVFLLVRRDSFDRGEHQ